MSERQPVAEKLPASVEYPAPTPWAEGRRHVIEGQLYWLVTVRPDGRPHVRPVLAVWLDGALYFAAGAGTRKRKNLIHDPHCAITTADDEAHMVVEGTATRVQDDAKLRRVAEAYAAKYDWHVTVRDGAFEAEYGAPTAGLPPYEVYEVTPETVFGFGANETFSPTRWRFDRG
ncbi:pyridoxamine 5'-phosphate oxidase family protein [Candidatus Roseilinea sp. NK_OTU-006]|uniref:pyridoxamine 5'-phosphate oxidase family protein n=1 Tax=Candidatus Roseilinea sp. NK_OTU-006 TaxID=2704250 RepID=UPI00145FAB5A|nr:pyridoxamine 5'-phosphate oxidase family protein [Candidatus Roseilinea sp. NK_OTU-006]